MQPSIDARVIDLGHGDWSGDDLPPRPRWRMPTWVAVLLAMAAVLAGLVTSGPPRPDVDGPLWTADGEVRNVIDGRVYLAPWPDYGSTTPPKSPTLVVRDVRTGAVLWRYEPDRSLQSVADLGAGLVGLTEATIGSLQADAVTRVVDAATGTTIGTVPGEPMGMVPGTGVVIFQQPLQGATRERCHQDSFCADVVGINVRTGVDVWRQPARVDAEPMFGWDQRGLTTFGLLDESGRVTQLDLATGRVLHVRDVPGWQGGAPAQYTTSGRLSLVDDYLIEQVRDVDDVGINRSITYSALALVDGRTWSLPLPAGTAADAGPAYLAACGRWICAFHERKSTIIDPETGRVMAERETWVTDLGYPGIIGWSVARDTFNPTAGPSGLMLFDPVRGVTTGHVPGEANQVLARPGSRTLAIVNRPPPLGYDIYAIDPSGTVTLITTIGRVGFCFPSQDLLVCSLDDPNGVGGRSPQGVSVWSLPPDPA